MPLKKYFSICRFFKTISITKSTAWLIILIFISNILSGCMLTGGMYQKLGSHERLTKKVKNVSIYGNIIKFYIIEDVYENNEAINIHASSIKTVEAECVGSLEEATILSKSDTEINKSETFLFKINTNSYNKLSYNYIDIHLTCSDIIKESDRKSDKLNYGPPFTVNDEYKNQINIKNTDFNSLQKSAEQIDSIMIFDETNKTINIFRSNSFYCIRKEKLWWSAPVKLLLTPFTVVIDIVTFPIQIFFVKKSLEKIT